MTDEEVSCTCNKLRGHVIISRTIPIEKYNSLKVEVKEEFFLSDSTFEERLESLAQRLKEKLADMGVVHS